MPTSPTGGSAILESFTRRIRQTCSFADTSWRRGKTEEQLSPYQRSLFTAMCSGSTSPTSTGCGL